MTLLIGKDLVVSMHYKLTDEEGVLIDSSEDKEPLTYLHGSHNIIPGLENALVGKVQGDKLKVSVEPKEAYGEIMPELIQVVERAAFDGVESIEVGMSFQAEGPEGETQQVTVAAVDGDEITIDSNHPLAGIALTFEVEIMSVREATSEELDHGHAH